MYSRFLCSCTWPIVFTWLFLPSNADAQPSVGAARVGGLVSAAVGDGGPAPSVGISAGYRFTPRLEVELDVSHVSRLDFGEFPVCPPGSMCVRGGSFSLQGRATSFTVNLISAWPLGGRARAYIAGGAGVARVRRERREDLFSAFNARTTTTDPVLAFNGGVDFLIWRRLAVGVALRYQRIFEKDQFSRSDIKHHLNLISVGPMVSYRF